MADMVTIHISPRTAYRRLVNALRTIGRAVSPRSQDDLIRDLAFAARDVIRDGIWRGRASWQELSDVTRAIKAGGRKLVDSGAFLRAIEAWKEGDAWYAGLPESAVGDGGEDLNTIGAVHEYGATIPVTDGVRKFFASKGFPLRSDTRYIVVPARPWFSPAMEEIERAAEEAAEKVAERIISHLGL